MPKATPNKKRRLSRVVTTSSTATTPSSSSSSTQQRQQQNATSTAAAVKVNKNTFSFLELRSNLKKRIQKSIVPTTNATLNVGGQPTVEKKQQSNYWDLFLEESHSSPKFVQMRKDCFTHHVQLLNDEMTRHHHQQQNSVQNFVQNSQNGQKASSKKEDVATQVERFVLKNHEKWKEQQEQQMGNESLCGLSCVWWLPLPVAIVQCDLSTFQQRLIFCCIFWRQKTCPFTIFCPCFFFVFVFGC